MLLIVQPSNWIKIFKQVFRRDDLLTRKYADTRVFKKKCRNDQVCDMARFVNQTASGELGVKFWSMASDNRLKFHYPVLTKTDVYKVFIENSTMSMLSIMKPLFGMSSTFYNLSGTKIPSFLLSNRVGFPNYCTVCKHEIQKIVSNTSVHLIDLDSYSTLTGKVSRAPPIGSKFNGFLEKFLKLKFRNYVSFTSSLLSMINYNDNVDELILRTTDGRKLSSLKAVKFSSVSSEQVNTTICMTQLIPSKPPCDKIFSLKKLDNLENNNSMSVIFVTTNDAFINETGSLSIVLAGNGRFNLSISAASSIISFHGNSTTGDGYCVGEMCVLDFRYYRRHDERKLTFLVERKRVRLLSPSGSSRFEINNATHIFDRIHLPDVIYLNRAVDFLGVSSTFPYKDVVHISSRFKDPYLEMNLTGPKHVANRARKGHFRYNVKFNMDDEILFELTGDTKHVIVLDDRIKNISIHHVLTYKDTVFMSVGVFVNRYSTGQMKIQKHTWTIVEIVFKQKWLEMYGHVAILTSHLRNDINEDVQLSLGGDYHRFNIGPNYVNTEMEVQTEISTLNRDDVFVFSNSLQKSMTVSVPDCETHVILRCTSQNNVIERVPPLYLRKRSNSQTPTVIFFKNILREARRVYGQVAELKIQRFRMDIAIDLSIARNQSTLLVVLENMVPGEKVPYVIFARHPMQIECLLDEDTCKLVPVPVYFDSRVEVVVLADPFVAPGTSIYIENQVESTVKLIRDLFGNLTLLSAGEALVALILLGFYESEVLKTLKIHFINWTVNLENL